ncbi:tRNA (adenosine(37)-N6)-threonylcarbamoyltransferase complex ATPase subunit type 1 TsaE [Sungkyunkwania multivorans]|uniref:tRNA threonylcarbamoyladenosine biosynthesis protein TsaE n=1 Tax=Sungkyunkwania multivorans TaxID=1173618 RepID=A0ABW3CY80_9FLAO
MEFTYQLSDIESVADKVLENIEHKVVTLEGAMGAGKTTLIKSIAKRLGVSTPISSPTFSLVNEHESDNGDLYHFDFYRIEDEIEAYDIGVEEYFYSDNWCFIEWPERIRNLVPEAHSTVKIEVLENDFRKLKILNN